MTMDESTTQTAEQPMRLVHLDAEFMVRNAFQMSVLVMGAMVVIALVAGYLIWPIATWQVGVAVGMPLFIALSAGLSAWLSRRGRSILGVWILLGGLILGVLAIDLLFAGLGGVLGLNVLLAILIIVSQTLPMRHAVRAMTLGILSGVALWQLDRLWTGTRLSVSTDVRDISLYAAGALFVMYGIFMVQQFSNLKLRTKLLIAFVAVNVLSVVGVTYFADRNARATLTETASRTLLAGASQTASALDTFINTTLDTMRTETQLPGLAEYLQMPAEQRPDSEQEQVADQTLQRLRNKGGAEILSYALLDMDGQNVLDTLSANQGQDESAYDYFNQAVWFSEPKVSDVLFAFDDRPVLYFSAPVFDEDNQSVGVLRAQYDALVLQRYMLQSGGVGGAESFAALLDENQIFMAHGAASELSFKAIGPLDLEEIQALVQEERLPPGSSQDMLLDLPDFEAGLESAAENLYFATTAHEGEAGLVDVDELPCFTARVSGEGQGVDQACVIKMQTRPWLVVYAQSRSAFLASAAQETRNMIVLAIAVAGVAIVVAVGVARFLSEPITRLTVVAQQVAEGDLMAQAVVQSQDETGRLAQAFNSMTEQLRRFIAGLEQRVADRTQDLERRSRQLQAAADVGRAVAVIRDLDELLPEVTELISARFGFYHAGIFLLDRSGEYAVLRAANSEGGKRMLARGHRLKVGEEGIVGYVTGTREPRIALDVGQDATYFDNPDMPDTRSEMGLPLIARGELLGVLDVQSVEEAAFSEEDVTVLKVLADQVAIAIDNARLFAQTQAALEAERRAYGELSRQAWMRMLRTRPDLGYLSSAQQAVSTIPSEWDTTMMQAAQAGQTVVDEQGSVALPIKIRGNVLGVVKFASPQDSDNWSSEQVALMETLTEQLEAALEGARLYQDTQRRAMQEQLIGEITARMRETLDVDTVLQTAVREIGQVLDIDEVEVRLQTGRISGTE